MRKWWLWFVMLVGMFWGGGQRVEAALPYQDLLFENVTWSPGQLTRGAIYAPPSELWVRVGTNVPLYFFGVMTNNFSTTGKQTVVFVRNDFDDQNIRLKSELNMPDFLDASVIIKARTMGVQHYEISVPNVGSESLEMKIELTLHVVEKLPRNLHINTNGMDILDFASVQLFPVDDAGHKYAVRMLQSKQDDSIISPLIFPDFLPEKSNSKTRVFIAPSGGDNPTINGINIGEYTIIHKPGPIVVSQQGEATVKLPTILPPTGTSQVQLIWWSDSDDGETLPIQSDGTVKFHNLKPSSFPMTWRIEYKTSNQTVGVGKYTYSGIQGDFATPLNMDLPSVPLPPLFTGTYNLAQIATGPIAVAPEWDQLDITTNGPWTLRISLKAPPVLPMRLRLGEQETGMEDAAIALSGVDNQTVSLAESRLIIPKTPLLSPGTYTAEITFSLIRGPTS